MEDVGILYGYFGIFYGHFVVIWYIFSVLVCTEKNLATLA
jgi:hypothetical protein